MSPLILLIVVAAAACMFQPYTGWAGDEALPVESAGGEQATAISPGQDNASHRARLLAQSDTMLQAAAPSAEDLPSHHTKLTLDAVPIIVKKPREDHDPRAPSAGATGLLLDVVLDGSAIDLADPYPSNDARGPGSHGGEEPQESLPNPAGEARRLLATSSSLPDPPGSTLTPGNNMSMVGLAWESDTTARRRGVSEVDIPSVAGLSPDASALSSPIGDGLSVSLDVYSDNMLRSSGYFRATLQVDTARAGLKPIPLEVTFVILLPPSMQGAWSEPVADAFMKVMGPLSQGDRFNIARLDEELRLFSVEPIPVRSSSLSKGRRFITAPGASDRSSSATLRDLLCVRSAARRSRSVVIISPPAAQLPVASAIELGAAAGACLDDPPTVHIVHLGGQGAGGEALAALAEATGGSSRVAVSPAGLVNVMLGALGSIERPVLTGLRLTATDSTIADVVPTVVPAVYEGRPAVVYGRFTGPASSTLWVGAYDRRGMVDTTIRFDPRVAKPRSGKVKGGWSRLHGHVKTLHSEPETGLPQQDVDVILD